MTEYNTHPTDESDQPYPRDQHVAGSRWSDRDDTGTPAAEGGVEPADDEPMVEHVEEHPIAEDHVGQHAATEPAWSEQPGDATASPFAADGTDEPTTDEADDGAIAMGAATPADDDLRDRTSDVRTPADEEPATPVTTDEPTDDEPVVPVAATDEEAAVPGSDAPATGSRPTTGDEATVDRLVAPAEAARFTSEWHDVKADFVDDPSSSLRRASDLSTQVLDELTASLSRLRQDLDDGWHAGDDSDTERLRIALRGYGSLIERILSA